MRSFSFPRKAPSRASSARVAIRFLDANRYVSQIAVGDKLYKLHNNGEIFVYHHAKWDPIYRKDR